MVKSVQRVAVITSRSTITRKKRGLDAHYVRACVLGVSLYENEPENSALYKCDLYGDAAIYLRSSFHFAQFIYGSALGATELVNATISNTITRFGTNYMACIRSYGYELGS